MNEKMQRLGLQDRWGEEFNFNELIDQLVNHLETLIGQEVYVSTDKLIKVLDQVEKHMKLVGKQMEQVEAEYARQLKKFKRERKRKQRELREAEKAQKRKEQSKQEKTERA